MGFRTEFGAELKRTGFTVRRSLSLARPGQLWIPAKIQLAGKQVIVTSADATIEFRASRLAWKGPAILSIFGLDEKYRLTSITLRFASEDAAKVAGGLLASQIEEKQSLEAKRGELPVELLATIRIGPFFLVLLAWFPAMLLALFLRAPSDVRTIISYVGLVAFVLAIGRLMDAEIKAGPARAWFRPRRVRAWISVDDDYFTVRTLDKADGFVPSRIEWAGTDSFVVVSDKTRLRILFGESDDATEMFEKIRQSFPKVEIATA